MSIFNEILPKLLAIQKTTVDNFNAELQVAFDCMDKFEEEYLNGKKNVRERTQKDKSLMRPTLQSIHETVDEPIKAPEAAKLVEDKQPDNEKRRRSKKRSKNEVEDMSSPEVDKRQKRNASVKAQSIITKQDKEKEILKELNQEGVAFVSSKKVNVNLTQKMRREGSLEKSRRRGEDDKENDEPVIPPVQIKQEKISLPPEPMALDSLALDSLPVTVQVKLEPSKDETAMPPPSAPVPKPRKALQKEKDKQKESEESSEDESGKRRTTRTRKQTDNMPPPTAPSAPSARSTRASSRTSRLTKQDSEEMPPPEARPKRTRAKKKISDSSATDTEKLSESAPASPIEKPRPKRTRRGKNAEKETQSEEQPLEPKDQDKPARDQEKPAKDQEKPAKDQEKSSKDQEKPAKDQEKPAKDQEKSAKDQEKPAKEQQKLTRGQEKLARDQEKLAKDQEKLAKDQEKLAKDQEISAPEIVLPKEERISEVKPGSPVIQVPKKQEAQEKKTTKSKKKQKQDKTDIDITQDSQSHITMDETKVIAPIMNVTVTLTDMDKTVVLPNGKYKHAPVTPQTVVKHRVNETVVLETFNRDTMVLEKHNVNDATVVLDPKPTNLTDDNSLLTDDSSEMEHSSHTPPHPKPELKPTSAVKEKVQQFEELAKRTTRTKTRAMAKMEEQDNTPPNKPVLSQDTLNKMNTMIFNGKTQQSSTQSASKPRAIPAPKQNATSSTSKLSSLYKHKEAAEERLKKEKEDARKKKEAMLEAKRELHKKKREEKMANAAAAREAAEKERKLAMEAATRERMERQLHADQGKMERLKEVERKKQELARKAAETEERRRAEEQARQQRLAEEKKKADAAWKKQLEETEASKKEAALMAKEIEKRQKEYLEKQKLKHSEKIHTPLKTPGTPGFYPMEPVYMADGFQFLNSDEEQETVQRPVPAWSTAKERKHLLAIQSEIDQVHIDKLFSVRVHSPDLREIFPNIERSRLKRTSSAVWRTPPSRLPPLKELV